MSTAPFGDSDIQAVIDGFGGVPVTVGATTANGILRRTDDPGNEFNADAGSLTATDISVLVRAAVFESQLAQGSLITVDAVLYEIVDFELIGHGATIRVYLTPVTP